MLKFEIDLNKENVKKEIYSAVYICKIHIIIFFPIVTFIFKLLQNICLHLKTQFRANLLSCQILNYHLNLNAALKCLLLIVKLKMRKNFLYIVNVYFNL